MKIQQIRLILLLFLGTTAAFADQFVWGNTYAQAWQGFGTSPYSATDTATKTNITIFCLDFNDEIAPPFTWNAGAWALNQQDVSTEAQYGGNYNNLLNAAYGVSKPGKPAPNQVTGAPFAFVTDNAGAVKADLTLSPDAYSRYMEAAWLFTELKTSGTQSSLALVAQVAAWDLFVNPSNIAALHADIQATNSSGAIYSFTDLVDTVNKTPNASGLNFEQAVDYALNAAQAAVVVNKTYTGSNWAIVTADPTWVESADGKDIPAQEFLSPNASPVRTQPPIPEPSAIVLLGTVAAMVGYAKRRKLV